MDISSDEQAKITRENMDMAKKRETLKEKCDSFLIAAQDNTLRTVRKQAKTRRNKIAYGGYVVIETKWLII